MKIATSTTELFSLALVHAITGMNFMKNPIPPIMGQIHGRGPRDFPGDEKWEISITWRDGARQGRVWRDQVWPGRAWYGSIRLVMIRRGMVEQGKNLVQ